MFKLSRISFGGAAAITGSMAFVVGLDAANASKVAIVSALLIAGIADNLTDSLSVHIYQESQRLDPHDVFVGTLTNFAARLAIYLGFVTIVGLLPMHLAIVGTVVFGALLLVALTYLIARERSVPVLPEVATHLIVAAIVILASKGIGYWINREFLS